MNDVDAGRRPERHTTLVALGRPGVVPGGGLLLGLTDIERVHLHKTEVAELTSSGDPDCPYWRREWVPVCAESDGFYGTFVDARTGRVGSWSEGNLPNDGQFPSLAAYFQDVAERLEGAASGESAARRAPGRDTGTEAIRLWARAHGYVVHDRGRIPSHIREAYEG
ncbi:histone-like nucleoid-structuring protein Lsr2 [Streptomyces sp. NPDC027717]|uniref:Lsr2 family DNA-binding protein n=1 Tax=Streptomyces sp. NPDC027717 TaxID=3155765 RepID=UPI0033DB3980